MLNKKNILAISVFILGNGTSAGLQITGIVNLTLGWIIIGLSTIVSLILFFFASRIKSNTENNKVPTSKKQKSKKEQATKIHENFIQREKEFWLELEKIPDSESSLDNSTIKTGNTLKIGQSGIHLDCPFFISGGRRDDSRGTPSNPQEIQRVQDQMGAVACGL